MSDRNQKTYYQLLWDIVRRVPAGRVTTYGQIAALVEGCTPRMAGYAMAAVRARSGVPWHRVINSKGEISLRQSGTGHQRQQWLLEAEGVVFDERGRVDLRTFQWDG